MWLVCSLLTYKRHPGTNIQIILKKTQPPLPQQQLHNCCHKSFTGPTKTKQQLWKLSWSLLLASCEIIRDETLQGSTLAPVSAGTCRAEVRVSLLALLRDKTGAISEYVSVWKSLSFLPCREKKRKKKGKKGNLSSCFCSCFLLCH